MRLLTAALLCAPWITSTSAAFAQSARDAKLLVTVIDQTKAVIPGATVTVTSLDDAKAAIAPATTSDQGIATVAMLPPGRYMVRAEFTGFEPGVLKDIRLRAGDNKHVIVLAIQGLQDSVTVSRDKQEAAADRRSDTTFGSALTREQIDALSDDPDEMAQQLQDMAGGGAIIRVDSFEGGKLPPKAQIKSIHITRDAFAAENHNAGAFFIDIITQPGIGPLRFGGRYSLRDGALAARNPFTPVKGDERLQNFGTNFGGSLLKDRSSFGLSINGSTSFDTPALNAALPTGQVSQALNLRSPRTNRSVFGNLDYALTKDQTLRFSYNQFDTTQQNLGVGAYDLPERAYANEDHQHTLRIQEAGPLGRRFFTNTRFELAWSNTLATPGLEAPTIRVNDAFTSGGAQIAGGRSTHTFNLMSDLDYVRGIHSLRTGVQFNGGSYSSNDTQNYLGTYTFESLAAYAAGRPQSYIRRIGDPAISYWNVQAGAYIQDDIRIRKGLTITPGLRYEAQTHLSDFNAFGPRFGVTWAPWKDGKTTLRASAGVFYDWLNSGTYEQTLRVDGFRQQELNIVNPSYPDPGNLGVVPPTNKYMLGDDLQMARNTRLSAGVDRALTPKVRIGASYAHISGTDLLRGLNLNQPVNGVRPNPAVGNLVEVVGDATSRQNTLNINLAVNLSPPMPTPSKQLWDGKRFNFGANYILGKIENDTDGAFSVPATGSLADDRGPANNDARHRLNVFMGTQALRNFMASLNLNYASASPYTIRTGLDDNGDLIFNDRPAGLGRNTARADSSFTLNGFFSYAFLFGPKRSGPGPTGIMINGAPGGDMRVQTFQIDAQPRYRLAIQVQAQNILNTTNYTGYSGTLTSPFFGLPTAAQGMRKIDVGLNF
ncbi:MAG: carboxypeptidase regulatory-like domain-containing protein, partial [Acidobacteriia bacterium]|nr:carboxypeptidase regulatory-like domain-containing protein [Terriglobia bacterium]